MSPIHQPSSVNLKGMGLEPKATYFAHLVLSSNSIAQTEKLTSQYSDT